MKKILLAVAAVFAFQTALLEAKAVPASPRSNSIYTLSPGINFIGGVVGPSFNSYIALAPLPDHEF
jgi:hypothetical protein